MADLNTERRGIRVDDNELLVIAAHYRDGAVPDGEELRGGDLFGEPTAPVAPTPTAAPVPELPADFSAATAELTRVGAIVDDALAPFVQQIMSVLAAPQLELFVEMTMVSGEVYPLTVSVSGDGAVFRRDTFDNRVELMAVDLTAVIPELFRSVDLTGPRPDPGWEHPIVVPSEALTAMAAAGTEQAQPAAGIAALQAFGLSPEEAETVALVLLERRSSMRVTSVWMRSPDETQTRDVVIIDGGKMGVWLSLVDAALTSTTVVPTTMVGAARAVADLVPYDGFAAWSPTA